jgi:hypothetical protein
LNLSLDREQQLSTGRMGERSAAHCRGLLAWVNESARWLGVAGAPDLEELCDGRALLELAGALSGSSASLGGLSGLAGVAEAVARLLGLPRSPPVRDAADAAQLVLGYAVQGARREECVALIMGLEPSVQQVLMLEVDAALRVLAGVQQVVPPQSPFPAALIEQARSAQAGEAPAPSTKRLLRENAAVRAENELLQADVASLQRQVEELQSAVGRAKQGSKEDLLRKEVDLAQQWAGREAALRSRLEAKEADAEQLAAALEQVRAQARAGDALRDQVDVLSAQAQQAAKSEQALARLKERVAQLSEVAQQAQELERANAALLQRSLAAEDAAHHVPRLSRELDAAKEAFSEAQLALGRALAVGEERAARERALRDEVEQLRCTESESLRDAVLSRELSDGAAEGGAAGQPGPGLGLSELNPAVRESLQQLESDNARLRAQLEGLSEANLARLEVENDGLQRLATKVQAQLRDSEQRGAALELALGEMGDAARRADADAARARADAEARFAALELRRTEEGAAAAARLAEHEAAARTAAEADEAAHEAERAGLELAGERERAAAEARLAAEQLAHADRHEALEAESAGRCAALEAEAAACLDALRGELAAAGAAHAAQLAGIVASAVAEECVAAAVAECERAELHVRLEGLVAVARAELAAAREQLADLSAEVAQEREQLARERERLAGAQEQLAGARERGTGLAVELEAAREEARSYRASHSASDTRVEALEAAQREAALLYEGALGAAREAHEEATRRAEVAHEAAAAEAARLEAAAAEAARLAAEADSAHLRKVNEMTARLLAAQGELELVGGRLGAAQEELERERGERAAAEQSVDKYRLHVDDLNYQVGQLRRQLKAAQVQRNLGSRPAAESSDQEDVLAEMQRLMQQTEQLAADNARLRAAAPAAARSEDRKGVSEMVRNYEGQIAQLQKEAHALSMAKTAEIMSRKEVENRLNRLAKDKEDVEAENTSLRLRLERLKVAQAKENEAPQQPHAHARPSRPPLAAAKSPAKPLRQAPLSPSAKGVAQAQGATASATASDAPATECNQQ